MMWAFLLLSLSLPPDSLTVEFVPLLHGEEIILGADAGAGLTVTALRCYLSDVRLAGEDGPGKTATERVHLLEATDPSSLSMTLHHSNHGALPVMSSTVARNDTLEFTVGIDSTTSASGVYGGDLDPTKGMYWTWRSGYIHFKLEGTSPDCTTRNQEFAYHLGGYLPGENTVRTIRLPLPKGDTVRVGIELAPFFAAVDLKGTPRVMRPGAEAVRLAGVFGKMFRMIE